MIKTVVDGEWEIIGLNAKLHSDLEDLMVDELIECRERIVNRVN